MCNSGMASVHGALIKTLLSPVEIYKSGVHRQEKILFATFLNNPGDLFEEETCVHENTAFMHFVECFCPGSYGRGMLRAEPTMGYW